MEIPIWQNQILASYIQVEFRYVGQSADNQADSLAKNGVDGEDSFSAPSF